MNSAITAAHEHLKGCKYVFLTLGTAITYSLNGVVVGNCHKLPAAQFERRMCSVKEVTDALEAAVKMLREVNMAVKVIFTVSPIRHIADGLSANSLSKSTLRVAVGEITAQMPDCLYFPSYEIMLDDLRDYRFYAADLKHLSDTAVDYIYDIFCETYFTPGTMRLAAESRRSALRAAHRPILKENDNENLC